MNDGSELSIIDFGLKEQGGHHAAFAEFLSVSAPAVLRRSTRVHAHCDVDDEVVNGLTKAECTVLPTFSGNYYYGARPNLAADEAAQFIDKLAQDFATTLTSTPASKKSIVLFPTMNWSHLVALDKALMLLRGTRDKAETATSHHKIVACVMFALIDTDSLAAKGIGLGFDLASHIRSLQQNPQVQLFPSDHELALQLQHLGKQEAPTTIHPCYLADWDALSKKRSQSKQHRNTNSSVLLYCGDAKPEKGFDQLPRIAEQCLAELPNSVQLTMQFTSAWGNQNIVATVEQLHRLAADEPRMQLVDRFWSHSELLAALQNADLCLLAHQARAYRYQSSGLLWLLGGMDTPIVLLERSWLVREAQRLGIEHTVSTKQELSATINRMLANRSNRPTVTSVGEAPAAAYRQALYAPFWQWLQDL